SRDIEYSKKQQQGCPNNKRKQFVFVLEAINHTIYKRTVHQTQKYICHNQGRKHHSSSGLFITTVLNGILISKQNSGCNHQSLNDTDAQLFEVQESFGHLTWFL